MLKHIYFCKKSYLDGSVAKSLGKQGTHNFLKCDKVDEIILLNTTQ